MARVSPDMFMDIFEFIQYRSKIIVNGENFLFDLHEHMQCQSKEDFCALMQEDVPYTHDDGEGEIVAEERHEPVDGVHLRHNGRLLLGQVSVKAGTVPARATHIQHMHTSTT